MQVITTVVGQRHELIQAMAMVLAQHLVLNWRRDSGHTPLVSGDAGAVHRILESRYQIVELFKRVNAKHLRVIVGFMSAISPGKLAFIA